jgi:peroxiredoxin Q/BCP
LEAWKIITSTFHNSFPSETVLLTIMLFRIYSSIGLFLTVTSSFTSGLSFPQQRQQQSNPISNTNIENNVGDLTSSSTNSELARRTFLNRVRTLTAASVAGGLVSSSTPSPAYADMLPQAGAKAPDFELPNSRGNGLTSLNGLIQNGKWTVLYFYPGAFTSGCTLEARGFQKDLDNYRKLNAQIVGVSVDPVEKNAQFCSEEKLDFFMLSDRAGLVSKKYGSALSVPGFGTFSNRQTYIIDPKGELRWIFTDVESRIARHSSEVLEKLSELEMTG